MNKELEIKLTGLISELEKGIELGKDQAPIIIQQVLEYDTFKAYGGIVFGVLLLLLAIYIVYKGYKNYKSENSDDDFYISLYICSLVALTISLIFLIKNIYTLVKINMVPNLYILDYLRSIG